MGKLFDQMKNRFQSQDDQWDETEYEEYYEEDGEEYYADENDEEYYAKDGEEEYYADENEAEYFAEGDEEYYADENEAEYFAEGDEEYYADESDEEYYAEGDEEYYADENDEEYYAEGGEEYYADENDEEYYAEGDEEYYAEDDEEYYANVDEEDDRYAAYTQESLGWKQLEGNFFEKIWYMYSHMTQGDRIIASTGIIILVLALITGSVYGGNVLLSREVAGFKTVGNQLEGITMIGEGGLTAVADAQVARLETANLVEEELRESEIPEYEEEEITKEVTVVMNMTSIKQDLKIKFVNKKTGKLIPNVPFEVEVTDAEGKSFTWADEDKDGIIYKKNIVSGNYKVAMKALSGYDDYKVSTATEKTTVKENIDYKKVDVSDEIKDESEIDASKEDTAKNENEEESKLQDTVTWVESTKTYVGDSYTEVNKSDITEPSTLVSRFNFMKLSGTGTASGGDAGEKVLSGISVKVTGGGTIEKGNTLTLSATVTATYTDGTSAEGLAPESVAWSSGNTGVAAVNGGTVQGVAAGTANIKAEVNYGGMTGNGSASVTVTEPAVASVTATVNKASTTLSVGGKETLTATTTDGNNKVKWSSSDSTTVSVDQAGVIQGLKAGTATITATPDISSGTAIPGSCVVTVTANNVTLKFDKTTANLLAGEKLELIPTITGNATSSTSIVWTSSNTGLATVSGTNAKCEVTGVKAGQVTITGTYTEGSTTATATCVITVKANPKLDKTTALKDKSGNQLYILNSAGQYVAAAYADFYTSTKFYLKQQGYKYTGWQTLDNKVYFFDANGNKVTGAQVIQGAAYSFDSNGVLVSSNGILGIDVSKWNGSINWAAVKNSGVHYVIIRCGYRGSSTGALIEDPKYRTNIQGATAAGLKVGVYFFTQAIDEVEAVEEASMVLSLVKGYSISYPIFLDVESSGEKSSGGRADKISKATRTAVCKAFCQTIQNSGYTAGVYANKTWLNNYIDAGALGSYKIWLAQYASAPSYSGRYNIWQYSSKGAVSGISGNVDMNLSYLGY